MKRWRGRRQTGWECWARKSGRARSRSRTVRDQSRRQATQQRSGFQNESLGRVLWRNSETMTTQQYKQHWGRQAVFCRAGCSVQIGVSTCKEELQRALMFTTPLVNAFFERSSSSEERDHLDQDHLCRCAQFLFAPAKNCGQQQASPPLCCFTWSVPPSPTWSRRAGLFFSFKLHSGYLQQASQSP